MSSVPESVLPVQGCIHCRPGRLCEYHKASNNVVEPMPETNPAETLRAMAEGATPETYRLLSTQKAACDAGAEAWEIVQQLKPYLEEIWAAHRDPQSSEYNQCEKDECAWCTETRSLLRGGGRRREDEKNETKT